MSQPRFPSSDYSTGFQRSPFNPERVKPRKTSFEFPPEEIPKLWVGDGSYFNTHLMNSMHMFLPAFEDLLIRVFKARIAQVEDPHLANQMRGFIGQEASHSRAHEKFCDTLRAHGYRIDGFVGRLNRIYRVVFEKILGTKITISCAAAFEHYTDLLVTLTLETEFFDRTDPRIKEFLAWHAAEEIEHNAVAYELLRSVNKGYLFRQLGHLIAVVAVFGSLYAGANHMLRQDRQLFRWQTLVDMRKFYYTKYHVSKRMRGLFWQYLRPGYHPDDDDYSGLAKSVLDPA